MLSSLLKRARRAFRGAVVVTVAALALALMLQPAAKAVNYSPTVSTNANQEGKITNAVAYYSARGTSFANNSAFVDSACTQGVIRRADEAFQALVDSVHQAGSEPTNTVADLTAMCTAKGKTIVGGVCR